VADQSRALPPKLAGRMNTSFLEDDDVLDNKDNHLLTIYMIPNYEMIEPPKTTGEGITTRNGW